MSENTKGSFFLASFKLSKMSLRLRPRILSFPIRVYYRFVIRWILGIDVPDTVEIGQGFCVFHGVGLVIHEATIIGNFVTVRQNTSIGNAHPSGGAPRIGNHVDIGANSVIIGDISIGDYSVIAAGSVVINDVPPNVIVAGNPARVVKVRS